VCTGTGSLEVLVSGSVRPICLILLTAVVSGFASPFPTGGRFAPAPDRAVRWHDSRALGSPAAGTLVGGVRLPPGGPTYFTWDPLLHRRPDRAWRRWGTDDLVRLVLRVAAKYADEHPHASRLGVGDLSRPKGGWFGPRHASHQNGLDVDVYYPRRDGRERPPVDVGQIDLGLAQWLVDLFVKAGATRVFVGPNTGLRGPPAVVQVLDGHDNHLHVRITCCAKAASTIAPWGGIRSPTSSVRSGASSGR
jgi:murein endopeptidase